MFDKSVFLGYHIEKGGGTVVGVVCELNPFHMGHKYILDKARENGPVVMVMSGNFTQRGSAAVFDKYTRAEAAVKAGADLVLELPFPWCSAGGAEFAAAGVALLYGIGAEKIMFGSGCGDADVLRRAGEIFASADFDKLLSEAEKKNPDVGAAKLREMIIAEILSPDIADILSNPNDILGVEYCRAATVLGDLECIPVKRTEGKGVISATGIRRMMEDGQWDECGKYIPECVRQVFDDAVDAGETVSERTLYDVERILLRTDAADFERAAECGGGAGHRLRRAAAESFDGEDMFCIAATKKYTDARLRRGALFACTGILWENIKARPLYTSVLAVGERGGELLRRIKKTSDIEILTKTADYNKLTSEAKEQFLRSFRADRFYTLIGKKPKKEEHYLAVTPYVAKK